MPKVPRAVNSKEAPGGFCFLLVGFLLVFESIRLTMKLSSEAVDKPNATFSPGITYYWQGVLYRYGFERTVFVCLRSTNRNHDRWELYMDQTWSNAATGVAIGLSTKLFRKSHIHSWVPEGSLAGFLGVPSRARLFLLSSAICLRIQFRNSHIHSIEPWPPDLAGRTVRVRVVSVDVPYWRLCAVGVVWAGPGPPV